MIEFIESVSVIMHACAMILFVCMSCSRLRTTYRMTLRERSRRRGARPQRVQVREVDLPTVETLNEGTRRSRRSRRKASVVAVDTQTPDPATAVPLDPATVAPTDPATVAPPDPASAAPLDPATAPEGPTVPLDICCVCMDDTRDVVLPCRHICTCVECTKQLLRTMDPKCPVCRMPFRRFTKVFFC